MLKKLGLENFRNISEKVEISFSKITLLFGQNNVGKTSIVNALDVLGNFDSQFNIPLSTDVANYGSLDNLYSKHNNKKFFKLSYQIEKFKKNHTENNYYEIEFKNKNKNIFKSIKHLSSDKLISELYIDNNNYLYFKNLDKNDFFYEQVINFFKHEKFLQDTFKDRLKSFKMLLPLFETYLHLEYFLSLEIDKYNKNNNNKIEISDKEIYDFLFTLDSSEKYSIESFFKKIENLEDIEDLLFRKINNSNLKSKYSKSFKSEDFDYQDTKNKKLIVASKNKLSFSLIEARSYALFLECFSNKDIDDIKNFFSIDKDLLLLLMSYKYCRDFLIDKVFKDLRTFEYFRFHRIDIENETDYKMYKDLISQFKKFSDLFINKEKVDLKTLIKNHSTFRVKLGESSFISFLGRSIIQSPDPSSYCIINIFNELERSKSNTRGNTRGAHKLIDFDLNNLTRLFSDFFSYNPKSNIYLAEETNDRVFTYKNSNSFTDLLYENRNDKNLLNRITNDLNSLGFNVKQISVESKENSFWIKIHSPSLITDLIDCGKGIKKTISFLTQIYCSHLEKPNFSLSENPNLICVEEPEANLHPKVQSELGSMITKAIKQNVVNQLVIETHSENMTLRLLKLIRENKLNNDDVAINCIYLDDKNIVRAKSIKIQKNGDIIDEWPGGFFDESLKEII